MDDAFAQRFDNTQDQKRDDINTNTVDDENGCNGVAPLFFCGLQERLGLRREPANKVPWSQWLMNKLGIELSVTSYATKADGSVMASTYTSTPGGSSGTYTNKNSRTYMENGKRVTVMSMEKDGNRIEDKIIAGKLVERKVNGKVEQIPQVVAY